MPPLSADARQRLSPRAGGERDRDHDKRIGALRSRIKTLEGEAETLRTELGKLRTKHRNLVARVEALEQAHP